MAPDQLIPLGRLVNVHATRGELRMLPYNPDSSTLRPGSAIVLQRDGTQQPRVVTAIRPHKRFLLLTLEGCSSMNAAEELVGCEVYITEGDLPQLQDHEIYHYELVGMTVVDLDGKAVGTVREVMALPGHDVCVVCNGAKEHLIPLVGAIARTIDRAQRRIVIDPPPGLLES